MSSKDIVERLRVADMNQAWSMRDDAADEIEQLRQRAANAESTVLRQFYEIERLREAIVILAADKQLVRTYGALPTEGSTLTAPNKQSRRSVKSDI